MIPGFYKIKYTMKVEQVIHIFDEDIANANNDPVKAAMLALEEVGFNGIELSFGVPTIMDHPGLHTDNPDDVPAEEWDIE